MVSNENEAVVSEGVSAELELGSECATGVSTGQRAEELQVDDVSETSDGGWDTDLEIEGNNIRKAAAGV